jgi:hypothetical protein
MLKFILEYILGQIEKLSFYTLVNCYFCIEIIKVVELQHHIELIPLCIPFEIEMVDACDINIDELISNIKWFNESINNLNTSDNIMIIIHVRNKGVGSSRLNYPPSVH